MCSVSSCAPSALEVFLSPKPSSNISQQQTASQQQLVLQQTSITQAASENRLLSQLSDSLRESEALIQSGETLLEEQNLVEGVREFERARILLETNVDPTMQNLERQSVILGGVSTLSVQQIQSLRSQRESLLARLNQAYDFREMFTQKQEYDQVNTLRQASAFVLQPIVVNPGTSFPEASKVSFVPSTYPSTTNHTLASFLAFDPRDFTDEIEQAISKFQTRKNDFQQCLLRADRYFPQVASTLAAYGVPNDFAYIAIIESGFQPSTVSSNGAAGLWQLSSAIARQYGLRINSSVDERKNIDRSTDAFARYAADLYRKFGSWELSLLGVINGEQMVYNAMTQTGSRDFMGLISQPGQFSRERHYLALLTAVKTIVNNPGIYGFNVSLVSSP